MGWVRVAASFVGLETIFTRKSDSKRQKIIREIKTETYRRQPLTRSKAKWKEDDTELGDPINDASRRYFWPVKRKRSKSERERERWR